MNHFIVAVLSALAGGTLTDYRRTDYIEHTIEPITVTPTLDMMGNRMLQYLARIDNVPIGVTLENDLFPNDKANVKICRGAQCEQYEMVCDGSNSIYVTAGKQLLVFTKLSFTKMLVIHTNREQESAAISCVTTSGTLTHAGRLTELSLILNDSNYLPKRIKNRPLNHLLALLFITGACSNNKTVRCDDVIVLPSARLNLYILPVDGKQCVCVSERFGRNQKITILSGTLDERRIVEICKCVYDDGYEVCECVRTRHKNSMINEYYVMPKGTTSCDITRNGSSQQTLTGKLNDHRGITFSV